MIKSFHYLFVRYAFASNIYPDDFLTLGDPSRPSLSFIFLLLISLNGTLLLGIYLSSNLTGD